MSIVRINPLFHKAMVIEPTLRLAFRSDHREILAEFCRRRLNISLFYIHFRPVLPSGRQLPCRFHLGSSNEMTVFAHCCRWGWQTIWDTPPQVNIRVQLNVTESDFFLAYIRHVISV